MKKLVIYIHGRGGSAAEAARYQPLFPDADVIGFAYQAQNPWQAAEEFPRFVDTYRKIYDVVWMIANSIGAFFALSALDQKRIDRAFLISPVVDMERLIGDMMDWAGVSEEQLEKQREITTDFGEILSWDYLRYVRSHPIRWDVPTSILHGERDHLTSQETIFAFAEKFSAKLTVMQGGEHWFHTEKQLQFLDDWLGKSAE
ncbi:MAG: alpha/beta hydrolase [Agathobaculum sp.]|uniref:alpha/beta hydrolase n=1 Tax=Agathobaculum sp. TaxID=2048138 RepID=UPI003D912BBA